MIGLDEIKAQGVSLGECGLLARVGSGSGLLDLLFSPQGREFCQKHSFPSIEHIRAVSEGLDTRAFVDRSIVVATDLENVMLAGKTEALVRYNDPTTLRHIVLMHGARATIYVSRYAVVTITIIGEGCSYEIHNDGTASVTIEG